MDQQTIKTGALCFGRAAPKAGTREGKEAELRLCRESVLLVEHALNCLPERQELAQ